MTTLATLADRCGTRPEVVLWHLSGTRGRPDIGSDLRTSGTGTGTVIHEDDVDTFVTRLRRHTLLGGARWNGVAA